MKTMNESLTKRILTGQINIINEIISLGKDKCWENLNDAKNQALIKLSKFSVEMKQKEYFEKIKSVNDDLGIIP